jgi:hypothetical protein
MVQAAERHTLGRAQQDRLNVGLDEELHRVMDPVLLRMMEKSGEGNLMKAKPPV